MIIYHVTAPFETVVKPLYFFLFIYLRAYKFSLIQENIVTRSFKNNDHFGIKRLICNLCFTVEHSKITEISITDNKAHLTMRHNKIKFQKSWPNLGLNALNTGLTN